MLSSPRSRATPTPISHFRERRRCLSCGAFLCQYNLAAECWPCGGTWDFNPQVQPMSAAMCDAIGDAIDRILVLA